MKDSYNNQIHINKMSDKHLLLLWKIYTIFICCLIFDVKTKIASFSKDFKKFHINKLKNFYNESKFNKNKNLYRKFKFQNFLEESLGILQ